jgi:hypothetical protein
MKKFNIENKWHYENGFYLTSDRQRYMKSYMHNELFNLSMKSKGDIFEFGVFKGNSLIRFATLSSYLTPNKKLYGFDMFGKFPRQSRSDDNYFIKQFENSSGDGIDKQYLNKFIKKKKITKVKLISGDINKTLPNFLKKNNPKISLLHIDVDVYEPTKIILELLYDKISKNGIIIFDDYNVVQGETDAVNEFFKARGLKKQIKKFKNFISPSYFIKE